MAPARTVALVGRPNVGKSRLFNRLARRRLAIVHDQAGVTRDVNSTVVEEDYTLLDTGGIGLVVDMDHQKLISAAEEQVWFAIEAAQLICLVVDVKEGLVPLDEMVADRLRASGKPVLLVLNKTDSVREEAQASEFARLGLGEGLPVSAEHGYGEDALREAIAAALGPKPEAPPAVDLGARLPIAVVGRPNVGKSSLINRFLEHDRLVVSEVAGTTRDAIALDLDFQAGKDETWPFRLVDTAGLRNRGKVSNSVEYFSTVRARRAIELAEVVFLVLDAEVGVTRADKALAGEILEAGRCLVVVVNKWDIAVDHFREDPLPGYDDIEQFRAAFEKAARKEFFFLPESPVVFVSALTQLNLRNLLGTARAVRARAARQIPTPKINRLLEQLLAARSPRVVSGRRLKIYYATQTGNMPFSFRVFCNRATKLDDPYRRYLERAFIREFGLEGCPVRFELKGKTVRYADKGRR
ncbi:MAG: ribosome biogenesis GTPase Der [Opitutales bacterium]